MAVNLRALIGKLNSATRTALEGAAGLCLSRTHYNIEPEHFLVKLLADPKTDVPLICRRFSIDQARLTAELTRTLDKLKAGNSKTPGISPMIYSLLREAWCVASLDFNAIEIRGGFVILALLDATPSIETPPEIRKVDAAELARHFDDIVADSSETTKVARQPSAEPAARSGPARVFISYRRGDGDNCADRLYDRLLASVPGIKVFRDLDTLRLGDDFANRIEATVKSCDVLIAVIGHQWLTGTPADGPSRIDSETDFVRMEIAAALRADKRVIPVLVDRATIPAAQLPPDIAALSSKHGLQVGMDRFRYDTEELVRELTQLANAR